MNEPRSLLALYKLLWEQIKDIENVGYIFDYVDGLNANKKERGVLENHMFENMSNDCFDTHTRKAFVLRMIKQLEN